MKLLFTVFIGIVVGLISHTAQAQDFVYEPKNPAFGGGNSFNYAWLLSAATAQNTQEDPARSAQNTVDPLGDFSNNLNRQILAQLTNRFISSQFGDGPVREGSYTIGAYQIQVTPGPNGVAIQVTDTGTGNQTTVTVPNVP
ncbi:curli production assembly/transport component CsgF [Hymenobacter sp. 102]|uniref:curli production assembly/transport component CsgF n=1 Tax=Hymenobacter sp. 102 TaxID=3403152 RepID=UPI003CF8F9D2